MNTIKTFICATAALLPSLTFAQLADSTKRLAPVEGAMNFRDIGGYKTMDGKEVVWGKIFRSDAINKLTEKDVSWMDKQGLHTVIDLRGEAEAKTAPDRLANGTDYTLSPAGSDKLPTANDMADMFKKKDYLLNFYAEGIDYYGKKYRPVFVKLLALEADGAMMYHCTGGRDRTGMQTALILHVLGVPYETIEADYLASNIYLARRPNGGFDKQKIAKALGMTEKEIDEKLALTPQTLASFFNAIKKKYGTVENFLQEEMSIGPKEIAHLRAKYTK
ncbi:MULTISPECIES: tyrosine-protein phosphatase [Sphingobacterium]|uniref:Tyrosine-protein phosphatase n=1 Tax=Sphingobacterium tenebrionis TaxID=3111775 RepID=A0ABU8I6V7_9SPHI|nr:tyrosine-protein phosphatase [Sphingobacterium sp. CZ-2]QBR11883.1 tyrosine-protein phosphatase [Sphingobacterium sp. CZ-2]